MVEEKFIYHKEISNEKALFDSIVAVDRKMGIAKNGIIPWNSPSDRKHFRDMTMGNTIIMGRKTWESLPNSLSGRINVVISSTLKDSNKYMKFSSLEECVKFFTQIQNSPVESFLAYNKIFVIGGEQIYNYFIENDLINTHHISVIDKDYECDKFYNR